MAGTIVRLLHHCNTNVDNVLPTESASVCYRVSIAFFALGMTSPNSAVCGVSQTSEL